MGAAGGVITNNVPDYAMVLCVPAKQRSWVSHHGHILPAPDGNVDLIYPESGMCYRLNKVMHCYRTDLG